jgi:hypothetical protein
VPCRGYNRPLDDAAEPFVAGVIVAPGDAPTDHAGLFLAGSVAGDAEDEVAQRGELAV